MAKVHGDKDAAKALERITGRTFHHKTIARYRKDEKDPIPHSRAFGGICFEVEEIREWAERRFHRGKVA